MSEATSLYSSLLSDGRRRYIYVVREREVELSEEERRKRSRIFADGTALQSDYMTMITLEYDKETGLEALTDISYGTQYGQNWNVDSVFSYIRNASVEQFLEEGFGFTNEDMYYTSILFETLMEIENKTGKTKEEAKEIVKRTLIFPSSGQDAIYKTIMKRFKNHDDNSRFLVIPYGITVMGEGHQVFLAVDLDYQNPQGEKQPLVTVFDSSHASCKFLSLDSDLNLYYFKFVPENATDKKIAIYKKPVNPERMQIFDFNLRKDGILSKIIDERCMGWAEAGMVLIIDALSKEQSIETNGSGFIKVVREATNELKVRQKMEEICTENGRRTPLTCGPTSPPSQQSAQSALSDQTGSLKHGLSAFVVVKAVTTSRSAPAQPANETHVEGLKRKRASSEQCLTKTDGLPSH